jgi:hypothetical protein
MAVGGLDDPIARMVRWRELRQRAAAAEAARDGTPPEGTPVLGAPVDQQPFGGTAQPGRATGASVETRALTPVEDLVDTVRRLAQRHDSLSIAVIAQDAGTTWQIHTNRVNGEVQVTAAPLSAVLERGSTGASAPPAAESSSATRLADMLRSNPTMLDD